MTDRRAPRAHRALTAVKVALIAAVAGGGWVAGRASALDLPWLFLAGAVIALTTGLATYFASELVVRRER